MNHLKLNLGCGLEYKKDYINIDAFDNTVADHVMSALDLEFEDNTFSQVDCIQVLEHLGAAKSIYALAEVYRVLSPKGVFLIETPDLVNSFKFFLKGNEDQRKQVMNWIYGLDTPGMTHRYGFPKELLEMMLFETGFVDIEITQNNPKSSFPSLRATARKPDSNIHQFFSFFRKQLLQTKLVDIENQIDVIEKETILQELLQVALYSKNSSQHLRKMLKATSTSSPKIGKLYLETAINYNLVSTEEASDYLRVLSELVSLGFAEVMTHIFQEMPVIPGEQTRTFETVETMCEQSVVKILLGDLSVIDELKNTSGKMDEEIQTDLFSNTVLEMISLSKLALGAKEFSQTQYDSAISHYEKAIRYNRDNVVGYWNLARLRTLKNMIEEGRNCYGVAKDLLRSKHPIIQRKYCKRIDDEIEYIRSGNRKQIDQPILSLRM